MVSFPLSPSFSRLLIIIAHLAVWRLHVTLNTTIHSYPFFLRKFLFLSKVLRFDSLNTDHGHMNEECGMCPFYIFRSPTAHMHPFKMERNIHGATTITTTQKLPSIIERVRTPKQIINDIRNYLFR